MINIAYFYFYTVPLKQEESICSGLYPFNLLFDSNYILF